MSIDEVLEHLKKLTKDNFYGKISSSYEKGGHVVTKVEISIKKK